MCLKTFRLEHLKTASRVQSPECPGTAQRFQPLSRWSPPHRCPEKGPPICRLAALVSSLFLPTQYRPPRSCPICQVTPPVPFDTAGPSTRVPRSSLCSISVSTSHVATIPVSTAPARRPTWLPRGVAAQIPVQKGPADAATVTLRMHGATAAPLSIHTTCKTHTKRDPPSCRTSEQPPGCPWCQSRAGCRVDFCRKKP